MAAMVRMGGPIGPNPLSDSLHHLRRLLRTALIAHTRGYREPLGLDGDRSRICGLRG